MSEEEQKHYISSQGLLCKNCGKPLDTKTTITMLCSNCKNKEWAVNQRSKFKDKYGVDNPMQIQQYVDKIQQTMQERYGTNCAMNVPLFRKKFENTCKERYGTSYFVNSPEYLNKMELGGCKSIINEQFGKLLTQNNIEYTVEEVRDDKRFDFKLKDKRIFIEIDPSYTHSVLPNHWDKDGHDKNFQLAKTLIANKYEYRCIHVFDWDSWDDIISLIKPTTRIYARQCKVKLASNSEAGQFINDNHIQKNCKGTKISIGLYYNDKLVQIMTFGKPRYNTNYQWELLRLCSQKGLVVVGGASKLFHYATHELKLTSIISYCDRSKFSGHIYQTVGMKLLRQTQPQEIWSKGNEKITGSLLRQRGFDQLFNTNYGKGTSNEQLMIEHGWLPVYDCGQLVFVYGEPIYKKETDNQEINQSIDYESILNNIEHKRKEKICAYCGLPFVPTNGSQRYCKRPHYMKCPVCNKEYLVTNNENLKRPPVACSYECRKARARQTNLERYGVESYTSTAEMQQKSKETMQKKYGVDYALSSPQIQQKSKETLLQKYGVDNIKKVKTVSELIDDKRHVNWIEKVHTCFPIKLGIDQSPKQLNRIDENKMNLYLLLEKVSVSFLAKYGHRINPKQGKIHMSFGLVFDKTVYQVIRFERATSNEIILADFGTKAGYYNPNGYTRLLKFAIQSRGIDAFYASIPRYIATPETLKSLSVEKIKDGDYTVYWKMKDGTLKQLTNRDNIDEMMKEYEYVTSDYIDLYRYNPQVNIEAMPCNSFFIQNTQTFES